MNKEETKLDECCIYFNFIKDDKIDIAGFSKYSGIEYQTLNGWKKNKKVSALGVIALDNILQRAKEKAKYSNLEEIDNLVTKIVLSKIDKSLLK